MSLDFYWVVLEVEEEFEIRLERADWAADVSVGDLYEAVLRALRAQRPERFADAAYPDKVWEQLKSLLVTQLALEPSEILPGARFSRELGLQ